MKKTITLFTACLLTAASYGQAIPGGDMETWKTYKSGSTTTLQRPDGWAASDSFVNLYVTTFGGTFSAQVSKEVTATHSGLAAAKMVTAQHTGVKDTFPGIITNGNFKINLLTLAYTFNGGMPVTSRVVSANAWTHYIPAATSDSGSLYVMALKAGAGVGGTDSVVGEGSAVIGAGSAYSLVTANIKYKDASVVPDHIIVVLFSSRKAPFLPGSTLYADDVTLTPASGIETPLFNSDLIKVFPNPASSLLHISNKGSEALNLNIYTASGQAVMTGNVASETDINISSLAAGNYIYVLSAAGSGRKLYSASFTKQ